MPRVHRLSDDELDEIEDDRSRRAAIRVIRWAYFDREDTEPELRAVARERADRYLRSTGLIPPGT